MPKLHLDEQVAPAIAEGLRRRGVDVTTTADADLSGQPDPVQLEYARQHQRVIFTFDTDFIVLHDEGIPHAGIAHCKAHSRTVGEIIQLLEVLVYVMDNDEI